MESSRSVVHLSTEQLYRKRAFDRENQRASRARKKTRIAELEDEVQELKERLSREEERAKRFESNEAALRKVIDSARSSLQSVDLSSSSGQDLMPSPPSSTDAHEREDTEKEFGATSTSQSLTSPTLSFSFPEPVGSVLTTEFGAIGLETDITENVNAMTLGNPNTSLTFGLPFVPSLDTMSYFWDNVFASELAPVTPYSLQFLDPFIPDTDSISWEPPTPKNSQLMRQWERVPLHLDPSCRLDTVLLELLRSSRQRTEKIPEFTGPVFPAIGSLLNPDTRNDFNPISNAIGVHGRVTMAMPSLELKIAIMYNMCVYLRWLITPTKQNYEAMPEYLRPIEIQLTIPHPAWIDVIAWPEARERIIRCMDWSEFEVLRAIGSHDMSINWPHGLYTVFTEIGGDMRMDPKFERHIRELGNWTMGGQVGERFPFLKGVSGRRGKETEEWDTEASAGIMGVHIL